MLFLWLASVAMGQVNTEKLRVADDRDGLSSLLKIGTKFKSGNVTLIDTQGSVRLQYKSKKSLTFLVADGQYAGQKTYATSKSNPELSIFDEEARYANRMMSHLRHTQNMSPVIGLEVFTQLEQNEFLLLDFRALAGTGPRLQLMHNKIFDLYYGSAYMYEIENLDTEIIAASEISKTRYHRWSNYITGSVKINKKIAWIGTVYAQPRFDNFSDYRVLCEQAFQLKLGKRLSWNVSFYLRHDSVPPKTNAEQGEIAPTDTATRNNLLLRF